MTTLPRIGAPATRALASVGVSTLEALTKHTEQELLALHGLGPKAMRALREAMHQHHLKFREEK